MASLERALAYLEKLPPAIQGSGGHAATWQAALVCRRFGLTESEMWQAMSWYNENRCQPPWSEKELRHKMSSAAKVQIARPLGQSRHAGPVGRPVSEADLRERMERRRAKRQRAEALAPICQHSEAEEDAWWAAVAAERGADLADWDRHGGRHP
jgi:hypothetical protein